MYDIPKCGEVVSIVPTPPHFSRVVDWWPNRQVLVWARTLADATRWTKPTMAVQLPKPRVTRRSVSDGILKFLINMVLPGKNTPTPTWLRTTPEYCCNPDGSWPKHWSDKRGITPATEKQSSASVPSFFLLKEYCTCKFATTVWICLGDKMKNVWKMILNQRCGKQNTGPFGGLNPGPPAPKAGIIPLDQTDRALPSHLTIKRLCPI